MGRRMQCVLLVALMLLSLAACGGQTEETPEPEDSPVEAPVELPPGPYVPAGTNPLTGEPMEEVYEADRPVAVMFNNLKAAQPQIGISRADIIYEVPAEGGITRMLALYQSLEGVDTLGSVRSTRPYYIELALAHDALLVHAGGSGGLPGYLRLGRGQHGRGQRRVRCGDLLAGPGAAKDHGLRAQHGHLREKILAYLAEGHFRRQYEEGYAEALAFAEDGTPAAGTAAEHISLKFSYLQDRHLRLRRRLRRVSGGSIRWALH